MINIRTKGNAGEREFCKWLFKTFELNKLPKRNLEQVRSGGTDIILPPFAFEVKRVEKPDWESFWCQSVIAARKLSEGDEYEGIFEAIVAHRYNRKPWTFLISADCIGVPNGFVHINERVFISYMANRRHF